MNARAWWIVAAVVAVIAVGLVAVQLGAVGAVLGQNDKHRAEDRLVTAAGARLNDMAFVGMAAGAPQYLEAQSPFRDHLSSLARAAQDNLEAYRLLSGDDANVAPLAQFLDRFQVQLESVGLRRDSASQAEALRGLVSATAPALRDAASGLATGRKDLAATVGQFQTSAAIAYVSRSARPLRLTTDKATYSQKEPVRLHLADLGEEAVDLPDTSPVAIYRETSPGQWERVARLSGPQTLVHMQPGQSLDMTWDNATGATPGQYEARVLSVAWDDNAFTARFTVK